MSLSWRSRSSFLLVLSLSACAGTSGETMPASTPPATESGFVSLFNGRDLTGWRAPAQDNVHWRVVDGVIDYDARSEAPDDKNLWSEDEYEDFVLQLEWRIKQHAGEFPTQDILPDGTPRLDEAGQPATVLRPDTDSGVYLRGTSKAQVNIWCWPIGSGEVWGYRTDASMPPDVRAAVTPRVRADKPVGEWNAFEITMRGDRLTVVLNGQTVIENARLPDVPARGRIALQHHGRWADGKFTNAASLVQFRNIRIRRL